MIYHYLHLLFSSIALLFPAQIPVFPPPGTRNSGIHLAISPSCGHLTGVPTNVNAGVNPLNTYKTIVSFGDSFTDGGVRNGGPRRPPVVIPPNPTAGGRYANGFVWVEHIGKDSNAIVMDYAVGGAVTDAKLWPSRAHASDFVKQVSRFLEQAHDLHPNSTLYTVFFGINDVVASRRDGTQNLTAAAQTLIDQITRLTNPPTNARSFLVLDNYGRGDATPSGDAFKQQYFHALQALRQSIPGFKVAFVDFYPLWAAVLGPSPGFRAFGYRSSGACLVRSDSTIGSCREPDRVFYWIPGHPSRVTHRIMAEYVEEALIKCTSNV